MRSFFLWLGVCGFLLLQGCGQGDSGTPAANSGQVAKSAQQPPPPPPQQPVQPPATPPETTDATGSAQPGMQPPADAATDAQNYPYLEIVMAAGNDRMTSAYRDCEDALRQNPTESELMMQKISILYSAGMTLVSGPNAEQGHAAFLAGMAGAEQVAEMMEEVPDNYQRFLNMIYYNGACAQALGGDAEAAKASLQKAIAYGWSDLDHLQNDSDLASVRALPGFDAELAQWQEAVRAAMIEKVRGELASGETFAFDFVVAGMDGAEIKLADLKGKVAIVDFWGTWCPPCRAEIPSFVKLQEQYGPQGLQIVGLNYERVPAEQAPATVNEFIAANGINYPCALAPDEIRDQVPDFQGYPTTLFIDRTGKVRLKIVGLHEYTYLEALVTTLLEETAEGTPPAASAP